MTIRVTFLDLCNADPARKSDGIIETFDGSRFAVDQDAVLVNDEVVAVRVGPHGLSAVHWERVGSSHLRFTDIRAEFVL